TPQLPSLGGRGEQIRGAGAPSLFGRGSGRSSPRIPDGYHLVGSTRETAPVALQPPTPSPSEPMGTGDASTNPSADGAPPAATPADAAKPPQTWHGLKHPVQPFAPPGASPVAPTTPGYYSLLDELRGKYLEKPPRWPYPRGGPIPPSFAEFDFSYLDALPWEQRDWAERLHRVPVGDHWLLS